MNYCFTVLLLSPCAFVTLKLINVFTYCTKRVSKECEQWMKSDKMFESLRNSCQPIRRYVITASLSDVESFAKRDMNDGRQCTVYSNNTANKAYCAVWRRNDRTSHLQSGHVSRLTSNHRRRHVTTLDKSFTHVSLSPRSIICTGQLGVRWWCSVTVGLASHWLCVTVS